MGFISCSLILPMTFSLSYIVRISAPGPEIEDAKIPVEKLPRWVKTLICIRSSRLQKKKISNRNLSSFGEMLLKYTNVKDSPDLYGRGPKDKR